MLARLLSVAFLLALSSAPAVAQCLDGNGVAVWPTAMTFEPAQPAAGEPVTAVLGAPISGGIANARSDRWGAVIELSGTTFGIDFTIPPPPTVRQFPLGALPRGTYTVTAKLVQEDGTGRTVSCLPLQAQLVVGGGGPVLEGIPVLSHWLPMALLAAALLSMAWRRSQR